ncbi:MAG: DUF6941 family protein [Actinomycetota bacterium]
MSEVLESDPQPELQVTVGNLTEPRLLALLLADYGSSSGDGKFSVSGIFDRIVVPKLPGRTTQFFLYLRLAETLGDKLQVWRIAPSGKVAGMLSVEMPPEDVGDEHPIFLQTLVRMNFVADEIGVYWFVVRFGERELGRAPVSIVIGSQEDGHGEYSATVPDSGRGAGDGDPAPETD